VYQVLAYFKNNNDIEKELLYFDNYLNKFSDDPWFLNQYAWRMTELNQNLELALDKVNLSLTLLEKDAQGIANIIDTKAEILWKLGKIDEAIQTIEEALMFEPENEYYQIQKEKFIESSNL
jgi:tetratricopeptide (TPR) repeat protein